MPGPTVEMEPVEPQSLKKLSFKSLKRALDLFSPIHGHFAPPDPERSLFVFFSFVLLKTLIYLFSCCALCFDVIEAFFYFFYGAVRRYGWAIRWWIFLLFFLFFIFKAVLRLMIWSVLVILFSLIKIYIIEIFVEDENWHKQCSFEPLVSLDVYLPMSKYW